MDEHEGDLVAAGAGEAGELDAPRRESPERRRWCAKLAERLTEVVEGGARDGAPVRLSPDVAAGLAMLAYDLGEKMQGRTGRFGDHPSELMLAYLLEQQGVSKVAALVTAQTMMSVDLDKLIVTADEAKTLVGISRTVMQDQVDAGRVRPAMHIRKGQRIRLSCYWLPDILWILGWRRTNPRQPGPYPWYPDPIPTRAALS